MNNPNRDRIRDQIRDPFRKLTSEEITQLPVKKWQGTIQLIQSDHQIADAVAQLRRESVVGFDTETKPIFKKGTIRAPALLQLAGTHCVYLFRLTHLQQFTPLAGLLEQEHILKVGIGIWQDMQQLQEVFPFRAAGLADLSTIAKHSGIPHYGIRSLAACCFGIRISKRAQCSNWERDELYPYQIEYAATDAWISREIYLMLTKINPAITAQSG
ncbi:MAG: 3'-5' exonuclease domain-containing protein 2 [Magnetococcales bacterium]|nr:3'-5' exonuclease domain-containing protein 2 [Magnetococcales bacterium]